MLPRALLVALLALLVACSSSPPAAPLDAGPVDVAEDVGAQDSGGSPDTGTSADAGACDPACGSLQVCDRSTRTCVWADAGTDTGAPLDVATDLALDTSPQDTGVADAGADTSTAVDSGADTGVGDTGSAPADVAAGDVPTDAPADTAPSCTTGSYRCSSTGALERCGSGGWSLANTCNAPPGAGTQETCRGGACVVCALGDGGACTSLCATDAECGDRGYARCVEGVCARRGRLRCSTEEDCRAFPGGLGYGCVTRTVDGAPVQICNGWAVVGCSADSMCPPTQHCDLATGYCVR